MVQATPLEASPEESRSRRRRWSAAAIRPGLRSAAYHLSLGLAVGFGAALAGSDLSAGALEGVSGQQSAVAWSTAKTNRTIKTAARPNSNRLKWRTPNSARAAKPAEPRPLKQPPDAAPMLGIQLHPATGGGSDKTGDERQAVGGEEREVIVLTTGEAPIVDPFDDPFEDRKPPARPSELKLFPVITAGELQPLEAEDEELQAPPAELEAPDEAPGEEMPADEPPADIIAPPVKKAPAQGSAEGDAETMLPGDDEFAQSPEIREDKCPTPRDLLPINKISNKIAAEPGIFPQECMLSDEPFKPRNFAKVDYTWKASALCHKPLYFEQVGVERYGHTWGPFLQPVVSSAHFFGSVIMLPYKMGVEPPWECVYPLGYYRPGSCAPYTVGPVPISLRGALAQTGATLGFVYIFAP